MHLLKWEGRPAAVDAWLSGAHGPHRSYDGTPPTSESNATLPKLLVDLRKWWGSLQPRCRHVPLGFPFRKPQTGPDDFAEWNEVAKGGENGIVLVIMCLVWCEQLIWYEYQRDPVDELAADISWTLERIVTQYKEMQAMGKSVGKRFGEDDGRQPRKRKRQN